MDYRLRYRDMPWHMVLFVPVGKIIGRCILDPIEYLIEYPMRVVKWILKKFCFYGVILALAAFIMITLDVGVVERRLGFANLVVDEACTYIIDCRSTEEVTQDMLEAAMEADRLEKAAIAERKIRDEQNLGEYEEHRLKKAEKVEMPEVKPKQAPVVTTRNPADRGY